MRRPWTAPAWLVAVLLLVGAAGAAAGVIVETGAWRRLGSAIGMLCLMMGTNLFFQRRRVESPEKRVLRDECPECGYPIGETLRCSECGSALPSMEERERRRRGVTREQELKAHARNLRDRIERRRG
jgi:hypothetical protein